MTAGGEAGGRTTHACLDTGTGADAAAVSTPARLSILRTPEGERHSPEAIWRRLGPSPLVAPTRGGAPGSRTGRPRRLPLARALAKPARTRSTITSRSN